MKVDISELSKLKNIFKTASRTNECSINRMIYSVKETVLDARHSYSRLSSLCTKISNETERIEALQKQLIEELQEVEQGLQKCITNNTGVEKEIVKRIGANPLIGGNPLSGSRLGKADINCRSTLGSFNARFYLNQLGVDFEEDELDELQVEESNVDEMLGLIKEEKNLFISLIDGSGKTTTGLDIFLDSNFKIVRNSKYYFIKGGRDVREALGLPKKFKVSSLHRSGPNGELYKNLNKAVKIEDATKFIKKVHLDKISKTMGKAANVFTYASAIWDVGEGVQTNINNGAAATEVVGDAVGDSIVAGGGIAFGTYATGQLAAAGAGIGTMICPGAGTLIGGAVGGIGGAIASGWLYDHTLGLSIGGKTIKTWIGDGCTYIVEGVCDIAGNVKDFTCDVGSAIGNGVKDFCNEAGEVLSDVGEAAVSGVSSFYDGVKEVGSNVIDGIGDFIGDGIDLVDSWF